MNATWRIFFICLIALKCTISFPNGITHPKVKWAFKTLGPIRSAALISGNSLYIGSADGFLYAINKANGALLWKFETGGAIVSSPALSDEQIVFCSRDNYVYGVNALTGKLNWKFQMQPILPGYMEWEYFAAAPVANETSVFVGSGDGNLYALDVRTGSLLWKYNVGARIRATPLLAGETIYQPANDGVVYVLSATDGRLLWNFKTEGASLDKSQGFDRTCLFTKPCLKDNMLVFGSRDGKTYGVDINSHTEKWRFTYGPTWAMSTALDGETVFVGWSTNNIFCAIDVTTGLEKWKYQCGSVVYSTAAVYNDHVVVGSADGNLYCFNKNTGKKNWQYKIGREIHASPIYDDNVIYVGSDDGYLYALEQGESPYLAVYQPLPEDKTNYPVIDSKISPYLKTKGFEQLDSAMLYKFIEKRLQDRKPSVIVFAYDVIPANIVGENPEKGMFRQYLETGGKVIWFGWIPNLFYFDSKGRGNGQRDITIASRLLEINFNTPEESGNYYSRATQDGLNLGLPPLLKLTYAVSPDGVIPLAIDEYNRISAWMKKFNDRSGSGFISFRTWAWSVSICDEDLELIRRMALHELE